MTPAERQARLARRYDAEILPAYAGRFATLLLRALDLRPAIRVVELGCATGVLTRELAQRLDSGSQLTALEAAPAFIAEARARVQVEPPARAAIVLVTDPGVPSAPSLPDGCADLVVSNLALAGAADPAAAIAGAAKILAPSGRLALSAPLRGTWAEFLDLFRDVLQESGRSASLAALDRYVATLPDGERLARWVESAGLDRIDVITARWEILFKSAREFFFAPLIEQGPLSDWKRLSGRGDQMQDAFFFTKEAIDTYFRDRVFAVSVVGAVVTGTRK